MQSVAVFCGSSRGASSVYMDSAAYLGKLLAEKGIALVYGGASVGVMGAIADAALEAGGRVIGVIPRLLEEREISHPHLTELIIVDTMHERKAKISALSDGYIVLPGGAGTMEEFFEVFTWAQIGLHQKPCGLFNINGYYDKLLEFFDHMLTEGFLQSKYRQALLVDDQPEILIERMSAYQAPSIKTYDEDPV